MKNKVFVSFLQSGQLIINIVPMSRILPEGILYHKLKGTHGWSSFFTQEIDVANVEKISFRKRLFKIFDRDRDYTIWITYRKLMNSTSISPTINEKGKYGVTFVDTVKATHLLSLRYLNEEDAIEEINEIQRKRDRLKKYDDDRYADIRKEFSD